MADHGCEDVVDDVSHVDGDVDIDEAGGETGYEGTGCVVYCDATAEDQYFYFFVRMCFKGPPSHNVNYSPQSNRSFHHDDHPINQ